MKILENGIYFKQEDQKEVGYYTRDSEGKLVHHAYKKPSYWQRMKFLATYGYEMNLETIQTSYFYFCPDSEVYFGTQMGDAVSTARKLRKGNTLLGLIPEKYFLIDNNTIKIETEEVVHYLKLSENGLYLKASGEIKGEKRKLKTEKYSFLDWGSI